MLTENRGQCDAVKAGLCKPKWDEVWSLSKLGGGKKAPVVHGMASVCANVSVCMSAPRWAWCRNAVIHE